jgi:hypothetical protein
MKPRRSLSGTISLLALTDAVWQRRARRSSGQNPTRFGNRNSRKKLHPKTQWSVVEV